MKKTIAIIIALILIIAALPLSAFAAPAPDIPEEMLDNAYGNTGQKPVMCNI